MTCPRSRPCIASIPTSTGRSRSGSAGAPARPDRRLGIAAAALAAAFLAAFTPARAASPVEGLWLTEKGEGLVWIGPCGPRLCGWLIDRDKLRVEGSGAAHEIAAGVRRPEVETALLTGFSGGPVRWDRGRIIDPRSGAVYESHLRLLSAARLKVSGCILHVLCGGQVWTRTLTP